jgi:hypothetical protein
VNNNNDIVEKVAQMIHKSNHVSAREHRQSNKTCCPSNACPSTRREGLSRSV